MLGKVCHIKCVKIFFLVNVVYSHRRKNRIKRNKKTFQHNFFVLMLLICRNKLEAFIQDSLYKVIRFFDSDAIINLNDQVMTFVR